MKRKSIPGKQNFGLYKYEGKKKDTYWVRREASDRRPLERKLTSTSLNDARKEADELIREWLGLKPKIQEVKVIDELWKEWIPTKADLSPATKYSIENSGKHLMEFFGNYLPSEITPDLWEKFVTKKRVKEPKRKFFNDWKWFNMFMISLTSNGLVTIRPKLRNPDPKRSSPGRVYSEDEVKALLLCAGGELKLQILMGYTMGMRIGEILNLTWERIDMVKKTITLRAEDTKIRRGRKFGISKVVHDFLTLRENKKGALFPSPTNSDKSVGKGGNKTAWRRCKKDAKVKGRFHDLRHTFLTSAFKSAKGKIDSMFICEFAGLSIEMAQEVYLHFDEEDTRAVTELVGLR